MKISGFYPSPLKGNTLYININSWKPERIKVIVEHITGQNISTHAVKIIEGSNNMSLTFSKLAPGTYILNVMDEKNISNTIRFVKC